MKKSILAALVFFSLPSLFYAEGWITTLGDSLTQYGNWIERTNDGCYIITGAWELSSYPDIRNRICLIKIDAHGDIVWKKLLAPNGYEFAGTTGRCVQQTSDSGYVVAGDCANYMALLKMDSGGDTVWTRLYGKDAGGYCVRQTGDGGYLIAGYIIISPSGLSDGWLVKTDSKGDTLWTRYYGTGSHRFTISLQMLKDDGCIITGINGQALWLHKINSKGDSLWSQTYLIGDPYIPDKGYSVEQTSDGGFIISGVADDGGFFTSGALFLLKTDSLGDSLWAKIYDPTSVWDAGASVHQTPDGGYVIAGTEGYSIQNTGSIWLVRTDSEGDMLWERTFEGNPNARGDCMTLCDDGGYAITGFASVDGSPDIILIKTDSLGYVGVDELPSPATPPPPLWDVASAVGPQITLKYKYLPEGFVLTIYDTSGRKVDALLPVGTSGTLTWGKGQAPGVYVIRERQGSRAKVVLLR